MWAVMRVSVALWVGAVILVSNFSYGWCSGKVHVKTQYRAHTNEEITAEVGLFVGLRGINITLKGKYNFCSTGCMYMYTNCAVKFKKNRIHPYVYLRINVWHANFVWSY